MFRAMCFCIFLSCLAVKPVNAFLYFLPDYHPTNISGGGTKGSTLERSCPQLGYNKTSCASGYSLSGQCPLSSKYFKECKKDPTCEELGFLSSCPSGQIPDLSQTCPSNTDRYKCKCDPCEGYTYTYEQATSAGYVVDGAGCQSCDVIKYKRKPAPCSGYNYDETNCNVTSCEKLEGGTCQSGTTVKYKECNPCIVPCPTGTVNIDTYWCDSALRCWLPAG